MNPNWPKTVAEAVDMLLNKELTEENIEKIRHMKKEESIDLHFGLGMWIRNNFGFFQGNKELLDDCAKHETHLANLPEDGVMPRYLFMHPDDASGVIVDALWERLQTGLSEGERRK